jgi:hypothetical protein
VTTTTARPTTTDRARELAEVFLGRAGITLQPAVNRDYALTLLARVLHRYPPPDGGHGSLVVSALIPRTAPYSPEELAVREIVRGGGAPTPRATHRMLQHLEHNRRMVEANRNGCAA